MTTALETIIRETKAVLEQKGHIDQEVTENTEFLGGDIDIDSLDLATLVVKLEEVFNKDPFREGFKEFRSVGELAKLYE